MEATSEKISLKAAIERGEFPRQGLFHRQQINGMRRGIERKRDLKRTLRDHRKGH